jgi:hypothetical protein
MKKVLLGCAVLLSVAVVLATRDEKKSVTTKHSSVVSAINIANDTLPKKDTTKPKKDTMMLAKY